MSDSMREKSCCVCVRDGVPQLVGCWCACHLVDQTQRAPEAERPTSRDGSIVVTREAAQLILEEMDLCQECLATGWHIDGDPPQRVTCWGLGNVARRYERAQQPTPEAERPAGETDCEPDHADEACGECARCRREMWEEELSKRRTAEGEASHLRRLLAEIERDMRTTALAAGQYGVECPIDDAAPHVAYADRLVEWADKIAALSSTGEAALTSAPSPLPSAEPEHPLCRRCGLPFLEDRICSGSHFTLLCAEAERPAGETPPAHIIDLAVQVSGWSPCRSKRGVVIYAGENVVTHGYNYKPRGFDCDQTAACKATCRREAIHAEQQALLSAGRKAEGADLLHVKTVNGQLVVSGGPSCVECSKLARAAGIAGVWLYHADGWQRYPIAEFHRQSLAAQPTGEASHLRRLLARWMAIEEAPDRIAAYLEVRAETEAALSSTGEAAPPPLSATVISVGPREAEVRWDGDGSIGLIPFSDLLGCRLTPPMED